MSALRILLVLGAGKNIGQGVAKSFKAAGYKIALVSRGASDGQTTSEGILTLRGDLSKPTTVPALFKTVTEKLGGAPTVVIYNAAAVTMPSDKTNPFTVPVEALESDMAVMNTSAYVAAREAVAGFAALPEDVPKAFIYTGNMLAAVSLPSAAFVGLATGKSAAASWIGSASKIFKDKGYKFFFADERAATGDPVYGGISGAAAAEFYLTLAEEGAEIPWYASFVSGKGFVDFAESRRL